MKHSFAALLALVPTAGAQHLLQQVEDPNLPAAPNTLFGWHVEFAGDLDQDGYDDFVVTEPFWNGTQGRVRAYSGRTSAELWHVDGQNGTSALGQGGVAAVGDLNTDGVSEILVSGSTVAIRILSGANGASLGAFDPHPGSGAEPEALGDVNGDGVGDYLATYSSSDFSGTPPLPGGRVYVVSGATHMSIRSHPGVFSAIYGANVIGDIDGDNVQDYAFWSGCVSDYCSAGYEVHSGATGNLIDSDTGGWGIYSTTRVVGVGDFDGDGRDDYHWFHETTPEFISPPIVVENRFVSGATGTTLMSLSPYSPYRVYGSAGDVDNDGRDEILALYDEYQEPRDLVALNPINLAEAWKIPGDPMRSFSGFNEPSYGGDVNADGSPDALIYAGSFDPQAFSAYLPSRVQAFSIDSPLAVEDFCFGDGGTTPGCTDCPCTNNASLGSRGGCVNSTGIGAQLRARGDVQLSDDQLEFELYAGPQSSFALLASGANALPGQGPCAPGSGISGTLLDGLRCVGADFRRHGTRAVDGDGNVGITNASWGASGGSSGNLLMQASVMLGQSRYFQAIFRDGVSSGACGTGQNTTNAVRVMPTP